MQPQNPNYAQRVRESFDRQQVMAHIGATLGEVGPGYTEIHMPYNTNLTQQHGYIHAGIVGTLADSAGGYAAFTLMPANASVLSIEYKLNLMRPAAGDRFTARGRVVRAGKTVTVCSVEVVSISGEEEKVCALMQMTLMTMYDLAEG